jgi:hypothetical protein
MLLDYTSDAKAVRSLARMVKNSEARRKAAGLIETITSAS